MAAAQSSRTNNRSTSTGPGIHSPGAAAASFYRASSGYGARSTSSYSSPSCPHHHQHPYQPQHHQHHHHVTPSSTHRHHASSSFANHQYYPSTASAFASSTSSSFLSASSSRSAPPGLFHGHHNQRHASPTRVNLVTGGVASHAASAPSVRFSLDSRSISPHNRGPIAVAPSSKRDPHHHQHTHHHYYHNHHSHHHPQPDLHHHQHQHHPHHQQIATGGRSVPGPHGSQHSHPQPRRTCMCSPTTHPGSFRCAYHKAAAAASFGVGGSSSYSLPSNRLNARRSAMTNSLVRIGTVEGDLVKRALAALIRPSSHQLRRRAAFQTRPSRLSVMSCAGEGDACAAAA